MLNIIRHTFGSTLTDQTAGLDFPSIGAGRVWEVFGDAFAAKCSAGSRGPTSMAMQSSACGDACGIVAPRATVSMKHNSQLLSCMHCAMIMKGHCK